MAKRKRPQAAPHQVSTEFAPPANLLGAGGADATLDRQVSEAQAYHAWLHLLDVHSALAQPTDCALRD